MPAPRCHTHADAIGDVMNEAKRAAPTHPHPMAPDTPPGNVVAGALAKILDSGKDLAQRLVEGGRRVAARRQQGGGARKKKSGRGQK